MVEYQVHVGGVHAFQHYNWIREIAQQAGLEEKSLGVFITHRHHLPDDQHFAHIVLSMQQIGDIIKRGKPLGDINVYERLQKDDITFTFVRTTETNDVTKFVMEH